MGQWHTPAEDVPAQTVTSHIDETGNEDISDRNPSPEVLFSENGFAQLIGDPKGRGGRSEEKGDPEGNTLEVPHEPFRRIERGLSMDVESVADRGGKCPDHV